MDEMYYTMNGKYFEWINSISFNQWIFFFKGGGRNGVWHMQIQGMMAATHKAQAIESFGTSQHN